MLNILCFLCSCQALSLRKDNEVPTILFRGTRIDASQRNLLKSVNQNFFVGRIFLPGKDVNANVDFKTWSVLSIILIINRDIDRAFQSLSVKIRNISTLRLFLQNPSRRAICTVVTVPIWLWQILGIQTFIDIFYSIFHPAVISLIAD